MASISVNLLPQDVILQRNHSAKLSLLNKLSITLLVVLTFFTSVTLTLRIAQSTELDHTRNNFAYAQDEVSGFKDKEEQLVILKRRLAGIESIIGSDTKKKALFNTILYLIPPGVQISDAEIDKKGVMSLTINTSSLDEINQYITALGSKDKNSDLVSRVDLDSLTSSKDNIYYLTLRITPK